MGQALEGDPSMNRIVACGQPLALALTRGLWGIANMATKSSIIAAINIKVGNSGFTIWRVGLTHDLAERKKYWRDTKGESVTHWSDWTTESLADAQDIESSFINKGMKGGTGGDLSARSTVYVYVF